MLSVYPPERLKDESDSLRVAGVEFLNSCIIFSLHAGRQNDQEVHMKEMRTVNGKTRAVLRGLTTLLFLGSMLMPGLVQAQGKNSPASFAELAEKYLPSVVNISSTQKVERSGMEMPERPQFPPGSPFEEFFDEFFERREQGRPSRPVIPPTSLGSGFVVDKDKGYIVTNSHVIRQAEEIRVTFHGDSTLEAELVGEDDKTDLAVLKVNMDELEDEVTEIEWGQSDDLRVGDWIVAIGNPFGLGGTVTAGIVSARQRNINAGPYDDFIQTDASINRGNSGGPMFNTEGGVIGINTAIFSPSGGSVGIGFAIPPDLARPVIKQLIEYGRTRRGWLGVRIQTVSDEISQSLGLPGEPRGALVASVTPGGPAEKAGIKPGDIILEFDGRDIAEMRELPRVVAETDIGKRVEVELWRGGQRKTLRAKLGELEQAEEEGLIPSYARNKEDGSAVPERGSGVEELGVSVSRITPEFRDAYEIPTGVEGVVVRSVTPGSEAARKRIAEGDVIAELNQKKIETPEDLKAAIEKAQEAGRNSVLLLINRAGESRFVALKLGA